MFSRKIYTAGTNFTRPPVVTVATNLKSEQHYHHHYHQSIFIKNSSPLVSERVSQSYNPGWELESQCSHLLELEQGCPHSNTPVKGFIFINIPFLLSYCLCLIIIITFYDSIIIIINHQNPQKPQRHPLCNSHWPSRFYRRRTGPPSKLPSSLCFGTLEI